MPNLTTDQIWDLYQLLKDKISIDETGTTLTIRNESGDVYIQASGKLRFQTTSSS